jgi:hypothetical protein
MNKWVRTYGYYVDDDGYNKKLGGDSKLETGWTHDKNMIRGCQQWGLFFFFFSFLFLL